MPAAVALLSLAAADAEARRFHPVSPEAFDGARALAETAAFVTNHIPRVAGTEGARQAAAYLQGRLESLGWRAETDEFLDVAPGGSNIFRNVIGVLSGERPGLIILGAHYDTKGGIADDFEGANDSGSGVGALLELARALAVSSWSGPEIWMAFFDGEEAAARYSETDGLHGSRRLARRLKESGESSGVAAVFILDMIGDRDLTVKIPRNTSPNLAHLVFQAARDEGVRDRFGLMDGTLLDDHEPFLRCGIPALALIDFEYGSRPGLNDYWHTPADRMDKLSAESLLTVGRVMIGVLNRLAEPAAPPQRPVTPAPRRKADRSTPR